MRCFRYLLPLLFLFNICQAENVIKISAPYDAKRVPHLVEIILDSYAKIGFQAEMVYMPAQRALVEASKNRGIGAEFLRARYAEEVIKNLIRIKVPLLNLKVGAFSKNKNIRFQDWASLSPYKVGTVRGMVGIEKNLEPQPYFKAHDLNQLFLMLKKDRLDLVVIPTQLFEGYQKENPNHGFTLLEPILEEVKMYHYIDAKYADITPQLTLAISERSGNLPED